MLKQARTWSLLVKKLPFETVALCDMDSLLLLHSSKSLVCDDSPLLQMSLLLSWKRYGLFLSSGVDGPSSFLCSSTRGSGMTLPSSSGTVQTYLPSTSAQILSIQIFTLYMISFQVFDQQRFCRPYASLFINICFQPCFSIYGSIILCV